MGLPDHFSVNVALICRFAGEDDRVRVDHSSSLGRRFGRPLVFRPKVGVMTDVRDAFIADLPGAYRVCLLTGDNGADATGMVRDPDLLGHVYVGAYLVSECELAAVVVDEQGVAGYVLGALDTTAFERWCDENWWPPLRARYPAHAAGLDGELVGLIHSPERASRELVASHPSHLHLDLLPRAQGLGLGRRLIERVLTELVRRGSTGVHLEVGRRNTNATAFYSHMGFGTVEVKPDALTMALPL
jgi:ribosomal protein S18 acetylase RimI-like enzyme